MTLRLRYGTGHSSQMLIKLEFSRQIYGRSWRMKLHPIRWMGAYLFQAVERRGGQTDERMDGPTDW